jgi:hypothetical protein
MAAGYRGTANGDSRWPALWADPDTGKEVLVIATAREGSLRGNGFYRCVDKAESLQFILNMIASFGAE